MAFFDQLGAKLTQTSSTAVQKTRDMAETMKLSGQISEKEKQVNQLYQEIGRIYYQNFADRDVELFRGPVSEIRSIEAELANMRETVRQLKGVQVCPTCGRELPAGTVFCSGCGTKLPEAPAAPEAEGGTACPVCGTVMPEGTAFCTNCGTKLPQPVVETPAGDNGTN